MLRRPSPALFSVVTLLGFLLGVAVLSARREPPELEARKAGLIALIEDRREELDALDDELIALRESVDETRSRAAEQTELTAEQAKALEELAAQAGTTGVEGRGLVVTLADSENQHQKGEDPGAYRIHDRDLQLVVNALFNSGAEAVSINGMRVVATTPIRGAGETIVVNFRPLAPPYRVEAVGADEDEFEDSTIARQFGKWEKAYGLQFSVEDKDQLDIPAFTGSVGLGEATPRRYRLMAALVGLVVGALIAVLLQPTVPQDATRYVAMAVVAAIDAAIGGLRSSLERTFNDRVFVIAFATNAVVAVGLVWIGDQLDTDLTTAVVVVLGVRIFQNVAAIRRRFVGG